MGKTTIEWANFTFNPWIGCAKASDGCKFCYAEEMMDKRYGKAQWGVNGTRVVTSDANWKQPLKWNRDAEKTGERARVFCASLADVFEDRQDLHAPRLRLFELIRQTPHLDWLLLTKRPENIVRAIEQALVLSNGGSAEDIANPGEYFYRVDGSDPETETGDWLNEWSGGNAPANVWLGTSVENQEAADKRVPALLGVPAAIRFLSCEPLLGPVELWGLQCGELFDAEGAPYYNALRGFSWWGDGDNGHRGPQIHWVICGGESGPKARPMALEWARSLRDQCQQATGAGRRTAFFMKQLGADPVVATMDEMHHNGEFISDMRKHYHLELRDKKGGDIEEFPDDLKVREFPNVAGVVA